MDELTAHGAAAVEIGATLTKLVVSAERVAETAEYVADVSNRVAGLALSTIWLALLHKLYCCVQRPNGVAGASGCTWSNRDSAVGKMDGTYGTYAQCERNRRRVCV